MHDPRLWQNRILFSGPERAALQHVKDWGFTDTFRLHTEEGGHYSWWDYRAGNFHTDELHVVERISARSADTLNYEATIEDPKIFTRPWKISMPLYRHVEPNAQLMEFRCVEFVEDLIYGHLRKQSAK